MVRPTVLLAALLTAAATSTFALWFVIGHRSDGGTETAQRGTPATAISERGLQTLADALGQPIYWAGPEAGMTYELTQTPDRRIYVRYLPTGAAVGTRTPYLTVATYPLVNAYAATTRVARSSTSATIKLGSGAVAFYNTTRPTSVYEAFPGWSYQIEVYAPSAAQARQLVADRLIRPVGGSGTRTAAPTVGAVAATLHDIQAVARRLGRPVFWVGRQPGTTYELTQTPDGRVYVRYLPPGVKAGSSKPYLTVATYPLDGADATTSAAAAQQGSVTIPVENGVAFYRKSRPTSVYISYGGADEQIEVFDPSASLLEKLVASGKVQPVP
jgi:hypothetical protein